MHSLPLPIAAFLAGVLSFLSPCVLPLVPGYVSLISGVSVEELQAGDKSLKRKVLLHAILFILGFSVVFIAFGAAATGLGQILGRYKEWILYVAGVIIILFGLHLTGILRIPFLYRDARLNSVKTEPTRAGSFLLGFAFAFGWSPCIGPILAAVLKFAAEQNTLAKGILLLAVYSLGLAVPFLITALAVDWFMHFYGKFRMHLHKVEVASGVLLICLGVLVFYGKFALLNVWLAKVPLFRALQEKFL
jgi:cytochrome c-type biogenesis protein